MTVTASFWPWLSGESLKIFQGVPSPFLDGARHSGSTVTHASPAAPPPRPAEVFTEAGGVGADARGGGLGGVLEAGGGGGGARVVSDDARGHRAAGGAWADALEAWTDTEEAVVSAGASAGGGGEATRKRTAPNVPDNLASPPPSMEGFPASAEGITWKRAASNVPGVVVQGYLAVLADRRGHRALGGALVDVGVSAGASAEEGGEATRKRAARDVPENWGGAGADVVEVVVSAVASAEGKIRKRAAPKVPEDGVISQLFEGLPAADSAARRTLSTLAATTSPKATRTPPTLHPYM